MSVPGSNLLRQALRVIRPITIEYGRTADRVVNPYGAWVTNYEPYVNIKASVQAVDRSRYATLGLDWSRKYVTIFTSHDVSAVEREKSPDRFRLPNGKVYTAVSDTDWYTLDGLWANSIPGWSAVLAVEGAAPISVDRP